MPKPKLHRSLPALLAGAAMLAPLAPAVAAGGFQLPPGSSERPKVQGPVDAGEPPPKLATPAPKPVPAPTPTPAQIAPVPVIAVPTPAPSVAVPVMAASSAAQPSIRPAQPGQVSTTAAPGGQPTPATNFNPLADDRPPLAAQSETPAIGPAPSPAKSSIPAWWPWAAGGIALLAILGGLAVLLLRRRKDRAHEEPAVEPPQVVRPVIERPPVAPRAAPPAPAVPPAPAPPVPQPEHGPLSIAVEAREMTISLSAATLAYRITLTNTGQAALGGVAIAGDMVSAHASLALEDQLANADSPLAPKHEIERIKPGESVQVTGELRLPFEAMRTIRKGSANMLIPLARLRVVTASGGNGALIRTALVGQRAASPGAGLQPFRLDLGPRIYREVTQKIFS